MKIKIHCRKCKSESLLIAKQTMSLVKAKEVILSIEEVIERHHDHPDFVDVAVEDEKSNATKNYIYDALKNRMK